MREPIEIFGHAVKPLTVGQVERIEAVVGGGAGKLGSAAAREIIAVALSRNHADVDVAEIECTVGELAAAMTAVLRLGGFLPPGEAPATPDPSASTGAPSAVA